MDLGRAVQNERQRAQTSSSITRAASSSMPESLKGERTYSTLTNLAVG